MLFVVVSSTATAISLAGPPSLRWTTMQLEGIHHVTAITGEAQPNVDFYAGVLGLRLVKKTVNQDSPTVYHLFYADEKGDPGSDITFFEYPGIGPGRAGDGMVHRILWRVASADSLDFWARRLGEHGIETAEVDGGRLRFSDPEGLEHELLVSDTDDEPLIAEHPEIPRRARAPGLRRRPRLRRPTRREPGAPARRRWASSRRRGRARWESGATAGARRTPTTSRPPRPVSRARAPSTTWPGRPRRTSTRRGATGSLGGRHARRRR